MISDLISNEQILKEYPPSMLDSKAMNYATWVRTGDWVDAQGSKLSLQDSERPQTWKALYDLYPDWYCVCIRHIYFGAELP